MKTTHTKPPVEIYDVLHLAEEKGVELPESVDEWWEEETALNEEEKSVNSHK